MTTDETQILAYRATFLGSTGCQPVLFGSLPKSFHFRKSLGETVVGRLPTTTGWQPVLPDPGKCRELTIRVLLFREAHESIAPASSLSHSRAISGSCVAFAGSSWSSRRCP